MKLGIMQPYFFPYLGYFSLINYVDKWIFFDSVQYIRHGWINRNRILKPDKGWQYIIVPIKKHNRNDLIKDVEVYNNNNSLERILRQLEHYKKTAPYFKETVQFLKNCFDCKAINISELNINCLLKTCNYLNIKINYEIYSKMEISLPNIEHPGDWALYIAKALKATQYVNPISGKEIFKKEDFLKNNIILKFFNLKPLTYYQGRSEFEPNLSIIDAMMFNSVFEIKNLLENIELT